MTKTFRAKLSDGDQDKIRLTTTDGRTGYKVVKFQGMPKTPGAGAVGEHILKIYKTSQSTIDGVVNFSDNDLLAVIYYNANTTSGDNDSSIVIFDNEIVNQDIYVTQSDVQGSSSCNYYIEMEEIKLTVAQAEVLIVKDLRKQPWTRP